MLKPFKYPKAQRYHRAGILGRKLFSPGFCIYAEGDFNPDL